MLIALTRGVSASLAQCELTFLDRQPIDVERARSQHGNYEQALRTLGCRVETLPEEPDLPDAVFVEDLALVLDEVAILTRPGVESRRPEADAITVALEHYRSLRFIQPPGTLEGGDILRLGRSLFVGLSGRSNQDGIRQLQEMTAPFGYSVQPATLRGCLHLKSAVTDITPDRLLLNPEWVAPETFEGWAWTGVAPGEAHAANALRIGGSVIYPRSFPRTFDILGRLGLQIHALDVSEIQKAEGAVTCCSLVFEAGAA